MHLTPLIKRRISLSSASSRCACKPHIPITKLRSSENIHRQDMKLLDFPSVFGVSAENWILGTINTVFLNNSAHYVIIQRFMIKLQVENWYTHTIHPRDYLIYIIAPLSGGTHRRASSTIPSWSALFSDLAIDYTFVFEWSRRQNRVVKLNHLTFTIERDGVTPKHIGGQGFQWIFPNKALSSHGAPITHTGAVNHSLQLIWRN